MKKEAKKEIWKKKAQLQISFAWIFAIVVGAAILFLAIYAATKVIKTGGEVSTAQTGKEISVLLNPLETGFETSVVTLLSMPIETRIYNQCSTSGNFGKQLLKVSQKNFNKWTETDLNISSANKYIFSESVAEGEGFIIFAKPFEFPFKVSDLIYLFSNDKKYCFFKPSREIKEELSELNQENIFSEEGACPLDSIKVCFEVGSSGSNCDIIVNEAQGSVKKNGEMVYYETDALMYAAIFSNKTVYECQVKRLMKRTNQLAKIYDEKQTLLVKLGCSPDVNVQALALASNSVIDSSDLASIEPIVREVNAKNYVTCGRFYVELW